MQAVSGAANSWQQLSVDIPAGTGSLSVVLAGGMGDGDLYVRFGEQPTATSFDCRPFLEGSNETCTIANPQAGAWKIGVNAFTDYTGANVTATWAPAKATATPPAPAQGQGSPFTRTVSGAVGTWERSSVEIPADTASLSVVLSGGMGAADLYVRFGEQPSEALFDCRPFLDSLDETCTIANPRAGVWHLGVNAFTDYTAVTLTATWTAAAPPPVTTPPVTTPPVTTPPVTTPPVTTPPATDWQTQVLSKHNELRAKHCAPAMTWDEEVAKTAQAWSDTCVFEHDTNNPNGENMARGSEQPADMWYSEVADYNFAAPGFSSKTGHFTQLVWRASTKLGCGRTMCPQGVTYVCRYAPGGNVTGQYEQNVLPSTTTCP